MSNSSENSIKKITDAQDKEARESTKWQDVLEKYCQDQNLGKPVYQMLSDRRDGRTAWSSVVTIRDHAPHQARYWYDGRYITNAKEDAAEVALIALGQVGGEEGGKR